jgi:hypothetical protein
MGKKVKKGYLRRIVEFFSRPTTGCRDSRRRLTIEPMESRRLLAEVAKGLEVTATWLSPFPDA